MTGYMMTATLRPASLQTQSRSYSPARVGANACASKLPVEERAALNAAEWCGGSY